MCKTEEEIQAILETLQRENPNLTEEEIRNSINSCCEQSQIVKNHDSFISCVKERIKMLRII